MHTIVNVDVSHTFEVTGERTRDGNIAIGTSCDEADF